MNKNVVIGLVIAAVVIFGGGYLLTSQEDSTSTSNSNQTNQNSEKPELATSGDANFESNYLKYSETALEQNQGKTKLLFFHAQWCPNCLAVERNLMEDTFPDDVVIIETDYDEFLELRQRYGVNQQTTFVQIDDNGEQINKWVARASDHIDDITDNIL